MRDLSLSGLDVFCLWLLLSLSGFDSANNTLYFFLHDLHIFIYLNSNPTFKHQTIFYQLESVTSSLSVSFSWGRKSR
jgi:hypothetical protein